MVAATPFPVVHPPYGVQTTVGTLVNVKLKYIVLAAIDVDTDPQSICLAVEPPTTILVAFTPPLTSNER